MGEFTVIESPTNECLAARAQQGCRASFAELVARFQVPLLHFVRQRTRSLHDAEDLTQDVFVRAFRSLGRYESRWRFSTWLYTIAHRLSLNARRRWRPAVDSRVLEGLSGAGPLPEESLASGEESSKLWRAAAAVLTAEQLTALWLFYVEDMPLEEIARVLGRSTGAAKGLLFRGRRKLAASLDFAMTPLGANSSATKRGGATIKGGAAIREASPAVERNRITLLPPRLATELYDG